MLAKWQCVLRTHTWRARSNRIASHRIISVKICSICAPSVFFGYYSLSCGFVTLNAWFLCGIRNIHMYMYHWLQCQSMAGISFYAISPHFFTSYAFLLILCFVATEMKFFFIHHSFVRLFVHHILTESRNSRQIHCVAFTFFAEIHMFH